MVVERVGSKAAELATGSITLAGSVPNTRQVPANAAVEVVSVQRCKTFVEREGGVRGGFSTWPSIAVAYSVRKKSVLI